MNVFSVDFALLLYDDFDGSPIADANVVFLSGDLPVTPLLKRDGYYVFRGASGSVSDLLITRPHYLPKRLLIEKSGLDPGFPTVRARLFRKNDNSFSDCEWLTGQCPPECEVLAFWEDDQLKLKAHEDDPAKLSIQGFATAKLVGRRYACDRQRGETFCIAEMLSPNLFVADRPLKLPAGRAQPLVQAYLSRSGPGGCYSIPVEPGRSNRMKATVCRGKEDEKWVPVPATADK